MEKIIGIVIVIFFSFIFIKEGLKGRERHEIVVISRGGRSHYKGKVADAMGLACIIIGIFLAIGSIYLIMH